MKVFLRYLTFGASVFMLAGFLTSCSQKKNTFTSRTFHNLAAHYNGLYWANVSIDEGVYNLEKAHKDDYGNILNIYKLANEQVAKANYPQFDRAIEKTNKVIQYHSMMIKGVEHCRWIDENYMAMGKAHYYKRDYYAAVIVFEYIVKVFPTNPAKYEAFIWLVRCYNQMNSVIKTGPILDLLKHDKKMPGRLVDEYQAALADYYLLTEDYGKAKEALRRAISVEKKKKVRGRYYFILAQLAEQEGDLAAATQLYSKCAKLHPSYEMEFNARLAKARTFQVGQGAGTKGMKKELAKMAKDEKNKEYLDQIYYAMGEIAFKENNIPGAMDYFKMSARASVANPRQKGLSYLRIADIYFDQKDYEPAQAFYDSTVVFLPTDYKDYETIKLKKETLTAMVKNLRIIQRQDSLLQLSTRDTVVLYKMIDEMIAKVKKEEEEEKAAQEEQLNNPSGGGLSGIPSDDPFSFGTGVAGAWYFYNSTSMSFGVSEFIKKWGNRPLEDNWRRSNKEVVMAVQEEVKDVSDTAKVKIPKHHKRDYYLKNIPFEEDQKKEAREKLVTAYYDLGGIYKEDLRDEEKAIETFEALVAQYPDNKYLLNLYYQLYRMYLRQENQGRINYYRDKIMNGYPNSEYARLLSNPDYHKMLKASRNEVENFYTQTYEAYDQGQYDQVLAMVSKADSFYSNSQMAPKFALLKAYTIGKTLTVSDYERALQSVVAKYPKEVEKDKAQELLDYLKKFKAKPVDSLNTDTIMAPVSPYTYADSLEHLCLIVLPSKGVNLNDLKARVSNFNKEFFSLEELSVNSLGLNTSRNMIIVKGFKLTRKSIDYYDLINQDAKVFKGMKIEEYAVFPISQQNFTVFYTRKDINEYMKYFEANYQKKKEE